MDGVISKTSYESTAHPTDVEISPGVNDTKGKSLLLSVRLLVLEHIWFSLLLLVSTNLLLLWPGKGKQGSNVESCYAQQNV